MDREILFRGKRIDNGEYIQGFYAKSGDKALILIDNDILVGYVTAKEVIPETLCQYTGLKDKNGTKIFEGDIVKYTDAGVFKVKECGVVKYKVASFEIEVFTNEDFVDIPLLENTENVSIIVIGNIYDNPELLEDNNDYQRKSIFKEFYKRI